MLQAWELITIDTEVPMNIFKKCIWKQCKIENSHGHSGTMQYSSCLARPTQTRPPNLGSGFPHFLCRVLTERVPQVAVQAAHSDHEVQFPWTVRCVWLQSNEKPFRNLEGRRIVLILALIKFIHQISKFNSIVTTELKFFWIEELIL